jgi:hypothetical protein
MSGYILLVLSAENYFVTEKSPIFRRLDLRRFTARLPLGNTIVKVGYKVLKIGLKTRYTAFCLKNRVKFSKVCLASGLFVFR